MQRADILSDLKVDHDITVVTMGWLREEFNPEWNRLSARRADEISDWLFKQGIGHLPAWLPPKDKEEVILYRRASYIGVIIDAARLDGEFTGHVGVAADFLLAAAVKLGSTVPPEIVMPDSTD